MPNVFRAAADVGLRRQRMIASGRFTPDTHRGYSEAGSWIAGAGDRLREAVRVVPLIGGFFANKGVGGPGATESVFDKLTTAVSGTAIDPATLMGFPTSTPPDWAAQPNGDTKYAFYTEGVDAGFVRGGVFGVLLGALAASGTHFVLMRMRKK